MKSECWLVLSDTSLQCYDRHPAGITRKPLNSFRWSDPQNLVVVLRKVDSRLVSYMKHQELLFAVEQHSSMTGVKQGIFIAGTLAEKEEWISAIESAITRNSGVLGDTSPSKCGVIGTPVHSSRRLTTRPTSTPCTTDSSAV